MKKIEIMKNDWLLAMADYVLEHGLSGASMRPLANAAGTSGRMLIYHFGSKDQLISELLFFIDARMEIEFTELMPQKRALTRRQCVTEILNHLWSVEKSGFMRIWYEILSRASAGEEPYVQVARGYTDTVVNWLVGYVPETEAYPLKTARALATFIEGISVMRAARKNENIDDAINLFLE